MNRRLVADWLWPLGVFGALAVVPELNVSIPKIFNQPISSPGTLALLASCLVFGALALTYDIQFGFTGLQSFGHALYIALGVYLSNIAITDWHWSFWLAIVFTMGVAFVLAIVLGFVSLRVGGIAFAMVTLAFAQAGAVLALKDPHHWTHGEEGLGADYTKLPHAFVGIFNTRNLYWLALAFLAFVFFVVRWAIGSSPSAARPRWKACRTRSGRRSSSRSSCSARSSSSSCSSCPAESPASRHAAVRAGSAACRRRSVPSPRSPLLRRTHDRIRIER